nr:MAG TPA: hypothetical protein [Caudoviricetes sp.]
MRRVYTKEEAELYDKMAPYLINNFDDKFCYKEGTPPDLIKAWEAQIEKERKEYEILMTMPITYNNKTEK